MNFIYFALGWYTLIILLLSGSSLTLAKDLYGAKKYTLIVMNLMCIAYVVWSMVRK
jgi:hypothetical protein